MVAGCTLKVPATALIEAYGKMTKTYAKMKEDAARQKATEFYVKIQIVGTPDDCIQQMAELRALTGTDHMIADFSYGGMRTRKAS
jgi:alkanesulfonate monooxygenase SsuD/methylene tetrahydromethanopterin reductase-like flavin-dependent oxidoreductase (luciferase family)